ncbi:MAG: Crp/Fnr family transcriptional regulator [Pseudomonadota bacterium]
MGPGSMLGLELSEDGQPSAYGHTAIALGEVDLCRIPLRIVQELESEHPELCVALVRRSEEHVRRADQVIVSFSSGLLRHRIENVLNFLLRETADDRDGFVLPTGADIAALVGASEESVSRIMAEYKRQGVLIQREDGLFMFDPPPVEVD